MREPKMLEPAEDDRPWQEIALGGGLSGLVSGGLMALAAMVGAELAHVGFWMPLRLVGAAWYGPAALDLGAGPVVMGLVLHLLTSAFWSMLFSFSVHPDTPAAGSFTGGLVYGVVVWALMTWTVLPWADPPLAARLQDIGGAWFLLHLLYGAGLAITPAMERLAGPTQGAQGAFPR